MDPRADVTAALPLGPATDAGSDRAHALLARWGNGDDEAFALLVREHQDGAYRYARRMCGDHDLARDLVQEAFIRVMRHHQRLETGRNFTAWFLHIVRNLAIDAMRRRKTRSQVPYEDHLRDATAGGQDKPLEARETKRQIAVVLAELPDKYREILIMREMDGIPAEDIATIIGVDYGTTRWRLHKARTLFHTAWTARYGAALP